jgi:hypothetical protein
MSVFIHRALKKLRSKKTAADFSQFKIPRTCAFYPDFLMECDRLPQKSRRAWRDSEETDQKYTRISSVDLPICHASGILLLLQSFLDSFLPCFPFVNLRERSLPGKLVVVPTDYPTEMTAVALSTRPSLIGRKSPTAEHISDTTASTDDPRRGKMVGDSCPGATGGHWEHPIR